MLRNLPAETIYSQIDYVSEQATQDSRRMLTAACGTDPSAAPREAQSPDDYLSLESDPFPSAVVVGAVRDVGRTRGRTLRTTAVSADRQDGSILWSAFAEMEPFLLHGSLHNSNLADPLRAKKYFDLLRRSCHDESATIIDLLEQQCDQRRQFDAQQRVHWWLHAWIPVHLGLSVALSILLLAHIWTAWKYW
jgi:hypothetical protein